MSVPPELEDELLRTALQLADDVRDDLGAAHRLLRQLGRLELEQVACVLAAIVDLDKPLPDWWRDLPEVRWPSP